MTANSTPDDQRQRWSDVDAFFGGLLGTADPDLDATHAASEAAGLPAISVSPLQGKFLHVLARAVGARRILEIGTLGGYSTTWLARALPAGGRLLSLEAAPRHAQVARANLERSGLADRVEVRIGPASASLRELVEAGSDPFDLVFIDADKPGYPDYLGLSLRLTRPGGVILADNVVRRGAVLRDDADADARGVRRFAELVAAEPRLTATVVQTVGSKGHDGFLMAVVDG